MSRLRSRLAAAEKKAAKDQPEAAGESGVCARISELAELYERGEGPPLPPAAEEGIRLLMARMAVYEAAEDVT